MISYPPCLTPRHTFRPRDKIIVVVVVVEYYCILIIYYCWPPSTPSSSPLSYETLIFNENRHHSRTKRSAPQGGPFVVGRFSASKPSIRRNRSRKKSKKRCARTSAALILNNTMRVSATEFVGSFLAIAIFFYFFVFFLSCVFENLRLA